MPRGFAHGFIVRSEIADFFYKCDELYSPADEQVLRWDDPQLDIDWGFANSVQTSVRARQQGRTLAELRGVAAIRDRLMRILLTGVSGQVGSALLPRLPKSHRTGSPTECSISPGLGLPTLDRMAPDLIFNPAAYTAVDKAEDEPEVAMRVNAEAPGALARWAAARDVPLIHFSTDYVFDGSGARPGARTMRRGPCPSTARPSLPARTKSAAPAARS